MTNDTDVDGDNLSATIVDAPDNNANFSFTSDGSFTYTSLEDFSGTDSFTYTVNDGELTSEPTTVEINVEAAPEPEPEPEPEPDTDTEVPPLGSGPDTDTDTDTGTETQPEPTPQPPLSQGGDIVNIAFNTDEADAASNLIFDTTPAGDGTDVVARLVDDVEDLGTEAAFDNLVGLYEVVDANGGIDTNGDGTADILPGQEGYALAAIENRVDNFVLRAGSNGDEDENTSAEEFGDVILEGGKLFAPFIIANGGDLGFDGFIESEGGEGNAFNNAAESIDDAVAYFGFTAANPDGAQHLQAFGNNIFGFEDLPSNLGVSDNDFNDAVFGFDFSA